VLAPGAVVARARKLRGEEVSEPAEPVLNKPDYQPTAPGSIRQVDSEPRFAPGDRVRTRPWAHAGHTRLPRYTRAHSGTIVAVRPAQVLPDSNAHFVAESAQHVFAVAFDSSELWGDGAESFVLTLDLYDDYLEPAR
jgi:nitrile hydratase subunit beta